MLPEKLNRVEDGLEKKIDAVAADLTAHRTDTEAHKRGYMVRAETVRQSTSFE